MNLDIVRAWKDDSYSLSLSAEDRASLPENPVGTVELTDADLEAVFGGHFSGACQSAAYICVSNVCFSAGCHNHSDAKVCVSNGICA